MAQKNILTKVKTVTGYDTLYPLTPYQIYQAQNVTGSGDNYNITIDFPAENITNYIKVGFSPNVANLSNCTININNIGALELFINGRHAEAGALSVNHSYIIKYDLTNNICELLSSSNGALCNGLLQNNLNAQYLNGKSLAEIVPSGIICMWSGSVIPDGWVLCNGLNGTPDLRNRFIVGIGSIYNLGDTGGEATHQLTVNEIPSHSHTISIAEGTHGQGRGVGTYGQYVNRSTTSVGGGQPHENRPPYYALAFIMKV